jgi:hypothetical protein
MPRTCRVYFLRSAEDPRKREDLLRRPGDSECEIRALRIIPCIGDQDGQELSCLISFDRMPNAATAVYR